MTLVIHRGGPHQCRDVTRPGPAPKVGDRVVLDDADFYNAVAQVVYTDERGRAWVYCERWDQGLDDRDLLYEGWGPCELPERFASDVYRFRLDDAYRTVAYSWDHFIATCVERPPTTEIESQSCANMRGSLHRALDELRSLTDGAPSASAQP